MAVIPVAERALEVGSPDELVSLLTRMVEHEARSRFEHVAALKRRAGNGTREARAYVGAMLDLQVWSHSLYLATKLQAHAEHTQAPADPHHHAA